MFVLSFRRSFPSIICKVKNNTIEEYFAVTDLGKTNKVKESRVMAKSRSLNHMFIPQQCKFRSFHRPRSSSTSPVQSSIPSFKLCIVHWLQLNKKSIPSCPTKSYVAKNLIKRLTFGVFQTNFWGFSVVFLWKVFLVDTFSLKVFFCENHLVHVW